MLAGDDELWLVVPTSLACCCPRLPARLEPNDNVSTCPATYEWQWLVEDLSAFKSSREISGMNCDSFCKGFLKYKDGNSSPCSIAEETFGMMTGESFLLAVVEFLLWFSFISSSICSRDFSFSAEPFPFSELLFPKSQCSLLSGLCDGMSRFSELESELRDFFCSQEGSWLKSGLKSEMPGSLLLLMEALLSWKLKYG